MPWNCLLCYVSRSVRIQFDHVSLWRTKKQCWMNMLLLELIESISRFFSLSNWLFYEQKRSSMLRIAGHTITEMSQSIWNYSVLNYIIKMRSFQFFLSIFKEIMELISIFQQTKSTNRSDEYSFWHLNHHPVLVPWNIFKINSKHLKQYLLNIIHTPYWFNGNKMIVPFVFPIFRYRMINNSVKLKVIKTSFNII